MKDLGYQKCFIEKLNYDKKDIASRMKTEHVKELADSIEKSVLLAPIVVNEGRDVIAGRDRIAAHLLLERTQISCHVVDATEEEMRAAERAENLYRRQDDRDALIAEEVAAEEARIKAEEEAAAITEAQEAEKVAEVAVDAEAPAKKAPKKKAKKGKKTAKGKAREVVAKKLKTTPDAVRKATERAEKKRNPKPKATGIKGDMAEIREAVVLVLSPLKVAQKAASKLLSKYGDIMGAGTDGFIRDTQKYLDDVTGRVSSLRPKEVCPECNGEHFIEGRDCNRCGAAGYLTEVEVSDRAAE